MNPMHPRLVSLALCSALVLTGCVSNRFKAAPKNTAPPQELNKTLAETPIAAGLRTLITYNGPGSWKRDAFWDEYVVTLRNPGPQPLTLSSVTLLDQAGAARSPGRNPWALEKESKTLEQKYKEAGIAFVRYTGPGLLIIGAGAGAVAATGVFTSAAAGAATATVIALPVYYIGVVAINFSNRRAMEQEFNRRNLALPLTLAPGETRTGSLFFPMIPAPRSLKMRWADGAASGEAVLPLDFLRHLHLKAPVPSIQSARHPPGR